ncbi:MAG: HAMP domain-containing sensor histidine kinase [Bacteroidales bacterium]|jgi:signal transduction histidine kinase|nr:HAMP domain-containing sensor histidine kinase [Bacteroidales bacterium]
MKRVILLLSLSLSLILPINTLFADDIKTEISQIIVNNKLLKNPFASDLLIEPTDKITFVLRKEYKYSSSLGLSFLINFNNGEIKKKITDNKISFSNLSEGVYSLIIQAYVDENSEIIPTNVKFIVRKKTARSKIEKPFNLPPKALYILFSVLLLELILILYLLFIKKDKEFIITEQEEFVNLDQAYSVLKQSYADLNTANKNLNFNIKRMERIIGNLEDANVELLDQKENLLVKKTQLEELHSQKDELYAVAIHDIKNPASAIKGLIRLLDDFDLTAQEQQEIMEGIVASSESIFKLTEELSSSISQEMNNNVINIENTSLKRVIDTVFTINNAYANKKEIRLVNRSSATLPNFNFDPNKIKEVIDNLINNAIKFGPKNTDVILESFFTDTKVTIEIRDNGVGLSDDDLKNIFTKGGKLSNRPTGNESSSGLGLWIVKKLVEAHEGTVWVKSKVGKGSTFVVEIPTNLTTEKVD